MYTLRILSRVEINVVIAGSRSKDIIKEPRAGFEKCQMLNKWKVVYKRIYSFIILLNPRDRKKVSEEKNCRTSPWQE